MSPHMGCQFSFGKKFFDTFGTFVISQFQMAPFSMVNQAWNRTEGISAFTAEVSTFSSVYRLVNCQLVCTSKGFGTTVTFERSSTWSKIRKLLTQRFHSALKSAKNRKMQKNREITFHKIIFLQKSTIWRLDAALFASKAKINAFWNFYKGAASKEPSEW